MPSAQQKKPEREAAAPASSSSPSSLSSMPPPYLHLQDRPYLCQPIDLAAPAAPDNKVGLITSPHWSFHNRADGN